MANDAQVDCIAQTIAILIALSVLEDSKPWPRVVVDMAIKEYWRGFSKLLDGHTEGRRQSN